MTQEAERSRQLLLQELEGKVADLEQRVAFEVGEKEAALRKGETASARAAALQAELSVERARGEDAAARLRASSDREAAQLDNLDACSKARAALEEERRKLRADLESATAGWSSQAQAKRRELEECRGRVADLEAQAALLMAERRRGERETAERIEEVISNSDRLVADTKKELQDCRARTAELEARAVTGGQAFEECVAQLAHAEEGVRAAEAERAAWREQADGLMEALRKAFEAEAADGTAAVASDGVGVALTLPLRALFAVRTLDLKPEGRDALRRAAATADGAGRRLLIRVRAEGEKTPGDLGKRYPTAWDLTAAAAARVARFLEKEAGMAAGRLAAAGEGPGEAGAGAVVVLEFLPAEPPPAEEPAVPPETPEPPGPQAPGAEPPPSQ